MTTAIVVELPEDVLVEALRRLTPARRRQLLLRVESEPAPALTTVPATELDKWTGLISVGGDALEDSECLYCERC
jgi:hypothetical protein